MKQKKYRMKRLLSAVITLLLLLCLAGCSDSEESTDVAESTNMRENTGDTSTALVPKEMAPNAVTPNPYMADSDNSVHNDSYNSDVTNAVFPLGIYSQLNLSLETQNPQAPSAAFYENR